MFKADYECLSESPCIVDPTVLNIVNIPFLFLQAEIRLRASWTGQSNYSWDFSKGPLQVDLKLLLCHFYHQSASICCETGVNLQLDSSRQQGALLSELQIRQHMFCDAVQKMCLIWDATDVGLESLEHLAIFLQAFV